MGGFDLPARLQAALSFVEGAVLADIGTDHAYLPIAACLAGKVTRAVACDINDGPLAKAAANINVYGLADKIETRLGNGLAPLLPGEADCIVIAGMGGMRIVEILMAGEDAARAAKRLVLQPQHDIPRLRRRLHENSYAICDEELVADGGRYYTIISAASTSRAPCMTEEHLHAPVRRPDATNGSGFCEAKVLSGWRHDDVWSELDYAYGKHILRKGGAVLDAYLQREAAQLVEYMKAGGNPSLKRRMELNREARLLVT